MQTGEINSSPDDLHYRRHLARIVYLLRHASGFAIDIGCGDPTIGAAILPPSCSYIGVDPFATDSESFSLFGASEDLPFRNEVFDLALFNTSLDHVLDYVTALREAHRVLRPGGHLYISTLIWQSRDTLLTDDVHFHHFRYFEILGALEYCGFALHHVNEYPYKQDDHRVGCYLEAIKLP